MQTRWVGLRGCPKPSPHGEDGCGPESCGLKPPPFPGKVALDNESPFQPESPRGHRGSIVNLLTYSSTSSSGLNWPDLSLLGDEQMEFSTHLSQVEM